MDENRTSEQANSFGREVGAYDSARPGYPDAAVDWLVPAHASTVLDIGAGTGKFTSSLVLRGFGTIAVESLVHLVASRSSIITAMEGERAATFAAVRELVASDPALAGRETFELPYRTHCFRTVLR
jgi:hypothetical protein